jgi:hypothetical protein
VSDLIVDLNPGRSAPRRRDAEEESVKEKPASAAELIAPCGMNCGLCASYQALVHDVKARGVRMPSCAGCRPRGKMCAFLKKRCDKLRRDAVRFCFECETFPCHELRTIDARYKDRYRMGMIENLESIRDRGLPAFLRAQRRKWACDRCGGTVSCHNGLCFGCDFKRLRTKKPLYRWDENRPGRRVVP